MKASKWTPYALLFLGVWQLAAPATFGYRLHASILSDLITGFVLIGFGLYLRKGMKTWALWAVAFVGVWMQLAPLVFWDPQAVSYASNTLAGVLAILFSIVLPPLSKEPVKNLGLIPPGWSYNPSSWPRRIPIASFAVIGWFISRYLAAYQLHYIDQMWDPFFGQGTLDVITSAISKDFPVSDAGLGAFAYTIDLLLTCSGDETRWRTSPWMVLLFGILVIPLSLVTILLIILQPLVVGAWCGWCLISAGCMVAMIPLAVGEVAAVMQLLRRSRGPTFWKVFWKGDDKKNGQPDKRTPPCDAPWRKLLPAMIWGVTPTWTLTLSLCVGVLLMISPSFLSMEKGLADVDHILGALMIANSSISMAENIRSWRFGNSLFALILVAFLCAGLAPTLLLFSTHFLMASLAIGLSIPRGTLREFV